MVTVNVMHTIYTIKVLTNQLIKRHTDTGFRSAIVIVSSMSSVMPMAGWVTYCCTKTFGSFLGAGLNFELKEHADVISYQPAYVSTKLLAKTRNFDANTISEDRATDVCFRDLGFEPASYGAFRHEFMLW